MEKREIEFEGIVSGDYEAMCFAVSKEQFKKIKGREPKNYERNPFHKCLYNLYPEELIFGFDNVNENSRVKVKLTTEVEILSENEGV